MKIIEFLEKLKEGSLTAEEHTHKIIEEAKKVNERYNYFNTISDDLALQQARQVDKEVKHNNIKKLSGIPVSVKDCLCVKDVESTAGSAILNNYKPVFNATAVQRLINQGAVIIGKASQDEFGFGGFSTNVGVNKRIPKNPVDGDRSCGGSSGGSAGWTRKTQFTHVALAESTGGSIVNPASFCGVIGFCPTYSRVSRYGLMDYASSLDKIGTMSRHIEDSAYIMNLIAGHDEKDSTSSTEPVTDYVKACNEPADMKIGLIKEFFQDIDPEITKAVKHSISKLEKAGAQIVDISLPATAKYSIPAYYLIATAEASTNLAKYCGLRYGASESLDGDFNEYFSKVRTKNLSFEAKRRIMLGTFARMAGYRDAYYLKALSVRTKITEEFKKAFKQVNVLASPTMPITAPTFDEISKLSALQNYMMDILNVGPNLAGMPHISIPTAEVKGLPSGLQLIADHFKEENLFKAGGKLC